MDFKEYINTKVIVRSVNAGVFYGEIVNIDGDTVEMKNARCLWHWSGAASLNQLAAEGVKYPDDCKFTVEIEQLVVMGVCEILKVTDVAQKVIGGVAPWKV